MSNLYTRRLSPTSGEAGSDDDDDSDGYGVFGGLAADAWSLVVASSVLAASVVIWEACAFAAMAAALAAGAAWCVSIAAAGWSASRAGTEDSAAAPGGGARGLAEVEVLALPAFPYQHHRAGGSAGGATCSVCLEEVRRGEMVRSLPECRHVFHVGCIDAWLQSHVTCPLCRSDLSPRRRDTMAAAAGLPGASPPLR